MSSSKGKGPSKWGSAVGAVNDAHQAQAEAVAEHAKETANTTTSAATSAQKKGSDSAKKISSKASTTATSAMASSSKSAAGAIAKSKGQGIAKQLQSDARRYLQNNGEPGADVLLKTLINSIMVGHAFNRYCIDPSTLPNALIICCITPRVITPATIAGAKNT